MPLSAADVRRRGDRIRRRRTALVAGGAALAVAAVAVPVFALAGGDPGRPDGDRVATAPTSEPLVEQDLLTDAQTEHIPGVADWFATDTREGDGQATSHPCQQSTYRGLGAEQVLQRDFEMRNLLPDAPKRVVDTALLNETIARFDSPEEARAAYDTVVEWILDCSEDRFPDAERVNVVPKARSVEVPTGGDAVIYDLSWGPVPESIDPDGNEFFINETGVVLVGDRIAVLTLTVTGQDYNFLPEEGGTPMERMVPPAADLLRPGG